MHHDEHLDQSIIIGFFPAEEHILDQNHETDIAVPSATAVDMDMASPLTVHDLPVFSPLLLISYRPLAYFTWNRTFSHVRQRLLEAVSGGLHFFSLLFFRYLPNVLIHLTPVLLHLSLHLHKPLCNYV